MREPGREKEQSIGSVLQGMIKAAPWAQRGELKAFDRAWLEAAGEGMARRSRVVAYARGTLTIHFESAAARHEVEAYRKEEILVRLRECCPDRRVEELKCVLR